MQGGDIEAARVQRLVFVWDGFIGRIPASRSLYYKGLVKAHQWERAFQQWDINDRVLVHLNDLFWRWNYRFDVVTWQPTEMADEMAAFFNRRNIPVAYLDTYEGPPELERALAYMPDVVKVCHADASAPFRFGGRGQLVLTTEGWNPLG